MMHRSARSGTARRATWSAVAALSRLVPRAMLARARNARRSSCARDAWSARRAAAVAASSAGRTGGWASEPVSISVSDFMPLLPRSAAAAPQNRLQPHLPAVANHDDFHLIARLMGPERIRKTLQVNYFVVSEADQYVAATDPCLFGG